MFGHNKGAGAGVGTDVGMQCTDDVSNDASFECR